MSNIDHKQCQTQCQIAGSGPMSRSSSAGFTLLELLVALLLIAILSSLAGPSFVDLIAQNRRQASLGDLFGMLSSARSEAVTNAATVVVCGSSDQTTCNSNNWEDGWIIFVDNGGLKDDGTAGDGTANDGIPHIHELVRVGQQASGDITIRTRNFPSAGSVSFNQDGFAESSGSFVVCDGDPADAAALVLNLSGQARIAVDEGPSPNGFLNLDIGEVTSCP